MLCVRLTGFVSLLRENGFSVGVDDATLLVDVASRIGVLDPLVLRWSSQPCSAAAPRTSSAFAIYSTPGFLPPNREKRVETPRQRYRCAGAKR